MGGQYIPEHKVEDVIGEKLLRSVQEQISAQLRVTGGLRNNRAGNKNQEQISISLITGQVYI